MSYLPSLAWSCLSRFLSAAEAAVIVDVAFAGAHPADMETGLGWPFAVAGSCLAIGLGQSAAIAAPDIGAGAGAAG